MAIEKAISPKKLKILQLISDLNIQQLMVFYD